MCFIFTCGETEFSKQLQGYENVVCQCHNCGNYAARVIKRNPWFTFCFIPVLPLSIHGHQDVVCSICRFAQPLENRQDVVAMANGGGGGAMPLQHNPQGGPPQGWGGGPGGGQPPKQQQNMQYG
ncbi:ribonuclease p complex subunit [Glarea lozoyensis ATCC 20868]|uniref:Ribonuclease p complex subunit n=1 Tax=Glarea lozoyensis (strain ATCC 20868 / MF5171) TaxID=1116229 RepID=S3D0L8_GLAL2|nr:ribonuclease p complex subunit [Glarea lozoyensis ATCC 20868]EPE30704.1 ribonuclease p complex subunit [Glarea lozoyensis ATCC 20868]